MGQKLKAPKGEISITNCEGRIRLRWRHSGERYSLSLPFAYQSENMHYVSVKVAEIKLDILKGCFDVTLKKYEYPTILKLIKPKTKQVEPTEVIEKVLFLHELAAKFNDWGKNIRNIEIDNSIDYLYIRKWLEKCINDPIDSIAEKLNSEDWAVTTYNRRLSYLNAFFGWLIETGSVNRNYLKGVCKKREKSKKKCLRRKPLEQNEIITLLEAIKNDSYCSKTSGYMHSHYYPFLAFIFYTGVRNAEAIGLRVRHIDFVNGQIEISETFARTVKGTNHAARKEKGTKMENVRYLPLSDELIAILKPQVQDKTQDEFVFKSPKGLSIDDRMHWEFPVRKIHS